MSNRAHGLWRVLRAIGAGGQGECVLVQRESDGLVAVRKQTEVYEVLQGFPLEAIILEKVLPRSPRITKLISFKLKPACRHRDNLIEWFEYCRGGDLHNAMEQLRGRVTEDFVWHCFIQLAEALDVIHNAGSERVVHRDIKPDNIFLEEEYHHEAPWPNVKLGDFGLATLDTHTSAMIVPCWQGPELPQLSAAGDVWALGAVIHWLAHGKPPIARRPARFRGSTEEWEMEPVARKPIPLDGLYSSKLNGYMMLCLTKNPNERISSQELVGLLRRDRPRPRWR